MTQAEKLRLQKAAGVGIDLHRSPLTRLALYALSLDLPGTDVLDAMRHAAGLELALPVRTDLERVVQQLVVARLQRRELVQHLRVDEVRDEPRARARRGRRAAAGGLGLRRKLGV